MTKVYIAGGWFNLLQMSAVTDIECALIDKGHDVFSPRLDNLGEDGIDWTGVYNKNLLMIDNCDIVIASTSGKDMGTLFECGYAAARDKKIIYYAPGLDGKFNLMLAKSAVRVCTSLKELIVCINEGFSEEEYTGSIE